MHRQLPPRLVAAIRIVLLVGMTVHALPLRGQGSGGVTGAVRASVDDGPLSYAVISLPQLSLERFTDPRGQFTLAAVPVGRHEVQVRRIGYAPYSGQVQVDSGATATITVALEPLVLRRPATSGRTLASCVRPGVPDPLGEPELHALYALLRENAERYRLLGRAHPFFYLHVRAVGELRDTSLFVHRIDTVLVRPAAQRAYQPGAVIERASDERSDAEYRLALPTLTDVAADAFVRAHCFGYAGTVRENDETWIRLDVRAADRIETPDVNGSFFLDSATAQLRRMSLTVSRPERLPRSRRGITGVTLTTSFRQLGSALSIIDKLCAVQQVQSAGAATTWIPAEVQQLLLYEFDAPPPEVRPRASELPPLDWIARRHIPRRSVWCAGS